MTRPRTRTLASLSLLYVAQGIPFGFATEYLPVVLREQHYSYTAIAALGWLQLPWNLKILWAKAADHPRLRTKTRSLILALQLLLTLAVSAFAIRPLAEAPMLWFALTFTCALFAATQDVFVDAFAVRVLREEERGYGNTAQVAGYRVGILIGGAALLLLVSRLGERFTLLGCAGVVAIASIGAFVSADEDPLPASEATKRDPKSTMALLKHMFGREAAPVIILALTYKLGLHMASPLLKPMAVDFHWTKQQIGFAVVTLGSAGALIGAGLGGVLHKVMKNERRALLVGVIAHAVTMLPLLLVLELKAPYALTTFAVFAEHFASGLGTTVLFAALMTATRKADAGLHYTILTSANAVAIGFGGLVGGLLADAVGKLAVFVIAAVLCLVPALLLPLWPRAAAASAR